MTKAKYDLYRNPESGSGNNTSGLHPRLVTNRTVETKDIALRIHKATTLTVPDVKAALVALGQEVSELLKDGERIYIEGLGYFQVTLCFKAPNEDKRIRGEAIRAKSVAFRPEKELKEKLKNMEFVRVKEKNIPPRKERKE